VEGVSCPDCKGTRLSRYGKTAAGLQKYQCLTCRRLFVAGSDHLIDPEQKKIIMSLLEQDTLPKIIRKAFPRISLRWLYELRKRIVSNEEKNNG